MSDILKMLAINVIIVLVYAVIALAVGFLAASQTILAEGLSNLSAAPVAVLNLLVMKYLDKRKSQLAELAKIGENGEKSSKMAKLEPIVGVLNNCFLLAVCVAVIVGSVQILLDGGNHEIQLVSSILFGLFALAYSTSVFVYFRKIARKTPSALVNATVIAWKFTMLIGTGIVVGFGVSWLLNWANFTKITPFIDPILAILLMLFFAISPILGIRDCFREILRE